MYLQYYVWSKTVKSLFSCHILSLATITKPSPFYISLPSHTLPFPKLANPYPTLPYPSTPTPTLPYRPTHFLPYPTYHHQTPILPYPTLPHLHPTPQYQYPSNFTPTLPPFLHYPTLVGYIRLGKDERYDGVVLGKDRFSIDHL